MMWQVLRSGVQRLVTQAFGSQLRRNMSSGVVATGANVLALGISYPIYLHYLGYEKYGLWLVLATVLGFAQMGMLGIRQAVMKLVAEEYAGENLRGIQSYVAMAWAILTVTGTTVLLAILFFKGQIIALFRLSDDNAELVSGLLPYIGLLTIYVFLVQVLNATLSGLGRMDLANYTQTAGRIAAVGMSILLLSFGGGIESLLIGNILSYVVVHIISLVFIRHEAKVRFLRLGNWSWQRFKRLLSFGSGVFGGSLMNMLLDPFNKLMLSRYAGVASVPVYEIAFKGSMQVRAVVEAGLRALMPEISRISANITAEARERIKTLNRRAARLILVGGVPLFCGLFIFIGVLLKAWLGERFVEALPGVFRIMLIYTFLSLICVPAFYTLMGLGRVGHIFVFQGISSITSALMLVLTVLAKSALQVSTVAYALLVGTALSAVYLLWQLHRSMKNSVTEASRTFENPLEDVIGCGRG